MHFLRIFLSPKLIFFTIHIQVDSLQIEKNPTDGRDKPTKDVQIVDCGAEELAEPFAVAKEDATE